MTTHTPTTHNEIHTGSFFRDYGLALGALALGLVAVVVSLFFSYVIGGLLGLVTWMAAGGARSVAKSTDGKGYAIAIVAAVLGAIAVAGLLLAGVFT